MFCGLTRVAMGTVGLLSAPPPRSLPGYQGVPCQAGFLSFFLRAAVYRAPQSAGRGPLTPRVADAAPGDLHGRAPLGLRRAAPFADPVLSSPTPGAVRLPALFAAALLPRGQLHREASRRGRATPFAWRRRRIRWRWRRWRIPIRPTNVHHHVCTVRTRGTGALPAAR